MRTDDAVFEALGDPTRRAIVELIRVRPRAVGEIADELPVSRPAVSKHLRVLEEARLVDFDVDGTRRVYRLAGEGFSALRAYADRMWDDTLAAFAAHAERRERPKGKRPT